MQRQWGRGARKWFKAHSAYHQSPSHPQNYAPAQGHQARRVRNPTPNPNRSHNLASCRELKLNQQCLMPWSDFFSFSNVFVKGAVGRTAEDYAVVYLGSSIFKITRLLIIAVSSVHIFACIFYKVRIWCNAPLCVLRMHTHLRRFHAISSNKNLAIQTSENHVPTPQTQAQVKDLSADSPEDVTAFYSSRGVGPAVRDSNVLSHVALKAVCRL